MNRYSLSLVIASPSLSHNTLQQTWAAIMVSRASTVTRRPTLLSLVVRSEEQEWADE